MAQLISLNELTNMSSDKKIKIIEKQHAEIERLKENKSKLEREKQDIANDRERLFYNLDYVIAHMPGFVYWKDLNSRYMGCNNNLANVSNLKDRSEIIGKTDYDFDWGKKQAEQFIKDDKYIIETKQTLTTEYELPVKREDGNHLYVRTDKMPFFDKAGNVIGVLAIAVDITDQKVLEKKLKEQIEKSEIANRVKTQFIENMEHDIRTPFCGVYGLADLLFARETDPEKKSLLGDISNSAKELYDYCNGILDFSTAEMGSLPLLEKELDLKELVTNVVKMETPAVNFQKLKLLLNYDDNIPPKLLGDEYRLKRILINLISNAIKFTKKGFIEVSVILAKKVDKENILLKFTVLDTGIGIPEDKQDIIYEKFAKLTPSNSGLYKGIGFGLTMVKQFIKELDGEISLKSELGEGSTFTCIIPFKIPLLLQTSD
jgi:PAS domain S-box-containing protein